MTGSTKKITKKRGYKDTSASEVRVTLTVSIQTLRFFNLEGHKNAPSKHTNGIGAERKNQVIHTAREEAQRERVVGEAPRAMAPSVDEEGGPEGDWLAIPGGGRGG